MSLGTQGLLTLHPFFSDRTLLCAPALGGILTAVLLGLDFGATIHKGARWHILLFALATAMSPRFVIAVDEAGAPLQVEVRVGQGVDTVGQAGRPKTLTGFQTHSTPVLLGVKDRAELGDDAYFALTPVLEGVVVLRKNPTGGRKAREEREAKEKERRLRLGAAGGARARSDLTWG
jgi:26S proteasome regulatory subunit N1